MPATLKSRLPQIIPEMAAKVSAIHVERAGAAEYAVVAGDEDVFWGHFLEHGTTKMAAQPFLIPAAEGRIGDIEAAVTAVLRGL